MPRAASIVDDGTRRTATGRSDGPGDVVIGVGVRRVEGPLVPPAADDAVISPSSELQLPSEVDLPTVYGALPWESPGTEPDVVRKNWSKS